MLGWLAFAASAADSTPAQIKFFETKIRPVLEENCVTCHGPQKQKGGLRLDSQAAMLKGGKEGEIVSPGKPQESKLLMAVGYQDADLQMPPDGALRPDQVAAIGEWVRMGTPWPEGAVLGESASGLKGKRRTITLDDRKFWSFQPVKSGPLPSLASTDASIQQWARNPVDQFVLAKLLSEGLTPAPEADRATLIRRLTFDLHGLPPTHQEVAAFVGDTSPTAYAALVDRLLASPRYGEHWARHWLDLVRYAESDGFKQDAYRPNAWPYRDYVIRSFNDDKPYDRFVTEQLAGDEIAPGDPTVMVATGFLRAGTYEYNNRDVARQWSQILDDVTDVTGDAFLGLSMGCARCHDHKFDPILQADYYRLRSFFAPMLPRNDLSLVTPDVKLKHDAAMAAWDANATAARERLAKYEKPASTLVMMPERDVKKFPEELWPVFHKAPSDRGPLDIQLTELAMRQVAAPKPVKPKIAPGEEKAYTAAKEALTALENERPAPLPTGLLLTDVGPVAPPTLLPSDPAHPIEPGYLVVLGQQPLQIPAITASPTSTGRRTALAKWITQPGNPLTTRVIANRIWQYHFGRGLVATSSDYGRLGAPPTHPELLDYLANRFVENGWSFKAMHRLILTSATYRQTALRATPEVARLKDPENRWLWRMNSRRLDAEQVRDAMLLASGELLPRGPGEPAEQSAPVRAIYTKALRNTRDGLLDVFDAPEAFSSVPTRNTTTTASQALLMINGDWPLKRAKALADRLYQQATSRTPAALVEAAYQITVGRPPRPDESRLAVAFLESAGTGPQVPVAITGSTDAPITQTMPQRGGQAILVRSANPADILCLPQPSSLGSGDFTVEAFVQLESIYDNASVRVIAGEWDGDPKHAGWSLGVTGEKSKHQPRRLILQVVSTDGKYEVIDSDFRLELHKAYYVAVAFKSTEANAGTAKFYLKDLTDMDAPLRSGTATHHQICSHASAAPLGIGGRFSSSGAPMGWDGLIDEIRLSKAVLTEDKLLYNDGDAGNLVCGHWMLKERPGFFKDSTGQQKDLVRTAKPGKATARNVAGSTGTDSILVDFCHVLLNSNEFLYVD